MTKFFLSTALTTALILSGTFFAKAADFVYPQDRASYDIDAQAPSIRLSMDKSELVHLDRNAASIIVGNPVHASILMDSPRLLVIVPKTPGATHFTVLDDNGAVILQRHIIVAAPHENYVRVRPAFCGEDAANCDNMTTYYCADEDMCHKIISQTDQEAASAPDETPPTSQEDLTEALAQ